MNYDYDPEDEQLANSGHPAFGKTYTFNGANLEPFTVCRDDLYTRLTFEPLSEREAAGLFIFVCLQPKERCVMVRGAKEEAKFRVEESEWREAIGWMKRADLRAEAMRIRAEVLSDIEKLQEVEPKEPTMPDGTPVHTSPGNV